MYNMVERMSEQVLLENPQTADSTDSSKEHRPKEHKTLDPSIIRFDTSEGLRLMIYLDAIKQLPSGVCVYPFSAYEDKEKIVVCKAEEKIRIYKVQ